MLDVDSSVEENAFQVACETLGIPVTVALMLSVILLCRALTRS